MAVARALSTITCNSRGFLMNPCFRNAFLGTVILFLGFAKAQAQIMGSVPRPPIVSLPYMNWDNDSQSYVLSDNFEGDGWQLHITHDNDRRIFCDMATLYAPIAKQGSQC